MSLLTITPTIKECATSVFSFEQQINRIDQSYRWIEQLCIVCNDGEGKVSYRSFSNLYKLFGDYDIHYNIHKGPKEDQVDLEVQNDGFTLALHVVFPDRLRRLIRKIHLLKTVTLTLNKGDIELCQQWNRAASGVSEIKFRRQDTHSVDDETISLNELTLDLEKAFFDSMALVRAVTNVSELTHQNQPNEVVQGVHTTISSIQVNDNVVIKGAPGSVDFTINGKLYLRPSQVRKRKPMVWLAIICYLHKFRGEFETEELCKLAKRSDVNLRAAFSDITERVSDVFDMKRMKFSNLKPGGEKYSVVTEVLNLHVELEGSLNQKDLLNWIQSQSESQGGKSSLFL